MKHFAVIISLTLLIGVAVYLQRGKTHASRAESTPSSPGADDPAATDGHEWTSGDSRRALVDPGSTHELPEQVDPQWQSLSGLSAEELRDFYFIDCFKGRVALIGKQLCKDVAPLLSVDLCLLYPTECQAIRDNPDKAIDEVLDPPSPADLASYYADNALIRDRIETEACLTALHEHLHEYFSEEARGARGESIQTHVFDHMEPWRSFIDGSIVERELLWARIQDYGDAIIAGASQYNDPDYVDRRPEANVELSRVLWSERCRLDNELLDEMTADDRFWFHLSRVVMFGFYDDSFWFSEDETEANNNHFPMYIPAR